MAKCLDSESVLEHTAFVALYSVKMCIDHKISDGEFLISMAKALLHDMEEVHTGDIATPTKYDNPDITEAIKKFERRAADRVAHEVFNSEFAYSMWSKSKDLNTVSGNIVLIADIAAVVHKIQKEVSLGNRTFLAYKSNILKALNDLQTDPRNRFAVDVLKLMDILETIV